MRTFVRRTVAALVYILSLAPAIAPADVRVLFDARDPAKTMFPSNLFTTFDFTQQTLLRVDLPKTDCHVQPVTCDDIDVLNTLDGFNLQPRISIPFSGPIDPASVTSDTVFLVSLGGAGGGPAGKKIGINQVVWDPEQHTLHVESGELLDPHTRYAVVVTDGVRDATGRPVRGEFLREFRRALREANRSSWRSYQEELGRRLGRLPHVAPDRVVALSVFTTMSTTSTLQKIHRDIARSKPAAADFHIGNAGSVRAVFALSAVTGILFQRQVGTAPAFAASPVPVAALHIVPGAVGQIAFGKYASPNYLAPGAFIPPAGTRLGRPVVQGVNDVYFNLFLPAGPRPAAGWPVAIFGHGFGSHKEAAPFTVAAKLAEQGIATVAINAVGHGGGPLGTLTVNTSAGAVSFPAGGRGTDQDGDGVIGAVEGSSAAPPRSLLGTTDALRQTVVDLMQLAHQIRHGVDIDGDGHADLDGGRVYYVGQSFGGIYGTLLLALDPHVRAGVLNVGGGPIIDVVRLSPVFRNGFFTPALAARGLDNLPPLVLPGGAIVPQADENMPLRNQPPVINDVAGAIAIQQFVDRAEWAGQTGSPVSYAPHIRKAPLPGALAKSIVFQFAQGDQTVPNPTSSAVVRAGDFADRVTYLRNDLAVALHPATPRNPHTFLTNIAAGGLAPLLAAQAQTQIATFFATDGAVVIDPDGTHPLFEVPIAGPLPEVLNFLP